MSSSIELNIYHREESKRFYISNPSKGLIEKFLEEAEKEDLKDAKERKNSDIKSFKEKVVFTKKWWKK